MASTSSLGLRTWIWRAFAQTALVRKAPVRLLWRKLESGAGRGDGAGDD